MEIRVDRNKLYLNGVEKKFDYNIATVLEFSKYCVILLMDDIVPDNNVMAIEYDGNVLWNISKIVSLKYPEAYISISKQGENTLSTVTYNGVKFLINTLDNQIIRKEITK